MNTSTPRVFIAATRQNDGKTTTSLGLLTSLQKRYGRVGYIKPVGQRFVEIDEHKIDEDTVLMDRVFRLNCPLVDMSPIAVEPDFTRKYLQSSNCDALVKRIEKAFDRVAWEKDFVLCEGSGHAGVGSVFDLSNARVAKILGAKAIIVTRGGIGKPIDEVAINQALFEKEGVQVIGVILNKVMSDKVELVAEFARKGLKRRGLELLGVIPNQVILTKPTFEVVCEEFRGEWLHKAKHTYQLVDHVVIGAMAVQNALHSFKRGALMITPVDRDDMIMAASAHYSTRGGEDGLAGMILTGAKRPESQLMRLINDMPFPVFFTNEDLYRVASIVYDMIVKTRPNDTEKISLIQKMIAQHVDVDKILKAL